MIYRRALPSILFGVVAYWFALGIGIPVWRDGVPGDATDIGVTIMIAAFIVSKRRGL